jgi:hypothetical protein
VAGGSLGALLVSLFNVKWRCSAPAGGVEGSKFCLLSVALPAKCVSRVSPRFHFRRHAFCFLPLATILENLISVFKETQILTTQCNIIYTHSLLFSVLVSVFIAVRIMNVVLVEL